MMEEIKLRDKVEHLIMQKVFTKYQIMRVRQKISFMAFIENKSILEIWLLTIKKSLSVLKRSK